MAREPLDVSAFDVTLRREPQWGVVAINEEGKPKPFCARTGAAASPRVPATWSTFSEAEEAFNEDERWVGVCYFFKKGDPHKGSVIWQGSGAKLIHAPRKWEGTVANGKHPSGLIPTPKLYTAAELQREVLPDTKWAVPGYVPEGVTMVVAHSKIGKTFLAQSAAAAVALGGRAWGKIQVTQGLVIYIDTEGNKRRVQRRLQGLLGEGAWPEELLLTHECVTLDANGFLILKTLVVRHKPRMMVLDTLNAMRPGKTQRSDLVKEDYDMLRALRALGEDHHCAILLLHHSSLSAKSDTVNAGAGTHGLAAAANVVLTFQRPRGEHDAIMDVTGNDITEEGKSHFTRDTRTGFWVLQGSGDHYMGTRLQQDIFDQLVRGGPQRPHEIATAIDKPRDNVRKALKRMAFSAEVTCNDGYYGVPTARN